MRRTIAPYRTLSTVFILAAIWTFVLSAKWGKWDLFESVLIVIGFYLPTIFIGLCYRISIQDGVITQKGFNMSVVAIKIKDISEVKQESSDVVTLAKMNRPVQRITIYSDADGVQSSIDISLKHFVADDIRRLLHAIQEERPDLLMPKTLDLKPGRVGKG